jgi:hypothetical protein
MKSLTISSIASSKNGERERGREKEKGRVALSIQEGQACTILLCLILSGCARDQCQR